MRLIVTASLALVAAAPATAMTPIVYDAFGSFTGTSVGGAFTYGTFDDTAALLPFTPYNDTPGCASLITNVICTSNGFLPAAFKSTSGAHQSGSVIVPGDALILHPGQNAGQSSAVVFTVPTAGRYNVNFSAFVADTTPSGTIVELFIPGVGFAPFAQLTAAAPTFSVSGPIGFQPAGFQFGFAINYDGVFYNDSTGVNYTVTQVPEPAAWSLMIAGFGLVGVASRRRRGAVAV